jgi:hypothetical protein
MYRPTDTLGGVTLGGRMSCSRCYQTLASWELTLVGYADNQLKDELTVEAVSSLTGALCASSIACSKCAADLAALSDDELPAF